MNAVVEVVTAKVVAETAEASVVTRLVHFPEVMAPVTTSALHVQVTSVGNHSISAIAPDTNFFRKELACA